MAAQRSTRRTSQDQKGKQRPGSKTGNATRPFKGKGGKPGPAGRGGLAASKPGGPKRSGRLKKRTPVPAVDATTVRLQKFLAAAGVGSRRDCELLIVEGRIEVDNQVVTELGTRIDPEKNVVTFDGQRVRAERMQYFMLNKPQGVLSTAHDPSGRPRVVDLISSHQRVYNVGRLDMSSEGLILVTNDGTLAQYLTHPSFGVEKVYHVVVKGVPKFEDLETLKHGVHLMEGVAKVKDVEIRKRHKDSAELLMVLDEGKNREIRRMLAKIGHKVVRLIRIAIGPLVMGDLPAGSHRRLTHEEVVELKEWAERVAKGQPPRTILSPKAKKELAARKQSGKHWAAKALAEPTKRDTSVSSDGQGADSTNSPAAPSQSTDQPTRVNPVAQKLATGRPIHLEDVQRSKELRSTEAERGRGKPRQASDRGRATPAPPGKGRPARSGPGTGPKSGRSGTSRPGAAGAPSSRPMGRKFQASGGSPRRGSAGPGPRGSSEGRSGAGRSNSGRPSDRRATTGPAGRGRPGKRAPKR
ncbi:MAG: pseudouridine synthase [Planctomycetaceae bacterium]|nr:pseudouridine synthase [Planctomycetaceae bacterium]